MTTNELNMNWLQNDNMPTKSKYDVNQSWKKKNALKEYKHSLKKVKDFPRVYKMPLAEALNKKDIIEQQLRDWNYTTESKLPYWPYKYAA